MIISLIIIIYPLSFSIKEAKCYEEKQEINDIFFGGSADCHFQKLIEWCKEGPLGY